MSDQPYETPTSHIYFTVQTSAACCVDGCVFDCVFTYIQVHRTPSDRVWDFQILYWRLTYLLLVYLQEPNPIMQPICRYKEVVMDPMHVTTKIKFIRKIINWTYWIRTCMMLRNPMGLLSRHWFDRLQTRTELYRTKNNVILRKWWSWKHGQTSNQTLVVPQGVEPSKSTNLLAPHWSRVWVSTQHIMDGPQACIL